MNHSFVIAFVALFLFGAVVSAPSQTAPYKVEDLPSISDLPDPFLKPDGKRVATPSEWKAQRKTLLASVLKYEYGDLPPTPRRVEGKTLAEIEEVFPHTDESGVSFPIRFIERKILLSMGPGSKVRTTLFLSTPVADSERDLAPVIIVGDLTWGRVASDIRIEVLRRGYVLAEFDRTEIAPDNDERGGVYAAYPEYEGGRIAAWSWGYSRVIDFLVRQGLVDWRKIVVTGHSRGGKAALLAGAIDERIAVTAPNNSGCGGAGCFRYQGEGSEDIGAILKNFPYWFQPNFKEFIGKTDRLPFDQHTVKALIAPRALLTTEGLEDAWANPSGSKVSYDAAKEVFRFLRRKERIGIQYRPGGHEHGLADWKALLDFSDQVLNPSNPAIRDFDQTVFFPNLPSLHSWKTPSK